MRFTVILSKAKQSFISENTINWRYYFLKVLFNLLKRIRFRRDSEPLRRSMDMSIDSYCWFVEPIIENYIRCLGSYTRKVHEFLPCVGYYPFISHNYSLASFPNVPG